MKVFALAAVPLLALGGCEEEPKKEEFVRPVKSMRVIDTKTFQKRWWPGRAKATETANLAFEVAGRLVKRPINVGDKVKARQLLAALDHRDFTNRLNAAKAELERATAQYKRTEKAAKVGAVSQQELTDTSSRVDVAKAKVKIHQKAYEDSRLFAPFAGTISAIYVENFENVRAKQAIARLLDTDKIEMIINIPENLISLSGYVKEVELRYDAYPGKSIKGQIKEVSNEASETTRTYPVTLIMDQPKDFEIKPGMAGEATASKIELPEHLSRKGFEVPPSAVLGKNGKNYVWVIDDKTKTVKKREVTVGELTPRGVLVKNLKAGELIAIAGVNFLRDGQKVTILEQ